jgi:hypothetical protein
MNSKSLVVGAMVLFFGIAFLSISAVAVYGVFFG